MLNLFSASLVSISAFTHNGVYQNRTEELVQGMHRHLKPSDKCMDIERMGKQSQPHHKELGQLRSRAGNNTTRRGLAHQFQPIVHLLIVGIDPHIHLFHFMIRKVFASSTFIGKLPYLDGFILLIKGYLPFLLGENQLTNLTQVVAEIHSS